ncbi:calcium-binding protein [Azospirillum thermophilum]|nr:calcium-binding protein [Azospirillum thermophilum]
MAVERVEGTSGNDRIWRRAGSQWLLGFAGNDTLGPGSGTDTVDGGSGDDLLYGGDDGDPDRLIGGPGNDAFWVNGPEDTIVEYSGGGRDTVHARYGWTLGDHLEDLTLQEKGASANGTATGNALSNRLTGNSGDNALFGLLGNDTLIGLDGNDALWGGRDDDSLEGGAGNDLLDGGSGSDSLRGGAGNDTLRAGDVISWDFLTGGPGDDLYYVRGRIDPFDHLDYTVEQPDEGIDTVISEGSWWLSDNTENLIIQEGDPYDGLTGWGNALSNRLVGSSYGNWLLGREGDDTLDGLGGDDILQGSAGNDVLLGRDGIDFFDGGSGDDLLDGGDGNDRLGISPDFNAVNTGRDTLIGGKGDDDLNGGGTPGKSDEVDFADAGDLIIFEAKDGGFGHDRLAGFNDRNDLIVFQGYRPDSLDGPVLISDITPYSRYPGALSWVANVAFKDGSTLYVTGISQGVPSFTEGSDYVFSESGRPIQAAPVAEAPSPGGIAAAVPGAAPSDPAAVERVEGTNGNDTIWRSAGSQWILGLAGDDTLGGGGGTDTVEGGAGNDVLFAGDDAVPDRLVGGTGNDSFWVNGPEDAVVEAAGEGIDTVFARYGWALGANLENLTLQEKGADSNGSATGNGLGNRLTGNGGNNWLDGQDGNDTIWAAAGNDSLEGGAGNDLMGGGQGMDTLLAGTGNDTLYAGDDTDMDSLIGGAGDDVYWVNGSDTRFDTWTPQDIIRERGGEGIDTVHVKGWWRLDANVENLIVQEPVPGVFSGGQGNELANRFVGSSSENEFNGDIGNDTINGMGGNDTLWGDSGNDVILGMAGRDILIGGYGDDLLDGGDGDDLLDIVGYGTEPARAGHDTIIGGRGNDRIDAGGSPSDGNTVNFADEGDLFLFAREGGGFGDDSLQGFNDETDRIVFQGYSHDDLTAPVTVTKVTPFPRYADSYSWTAELSFRDGSRLHVTGVSQGAPSFTEGSDFVFAAAGAGATPSP